MKISNSRGFAFIAIVAVIFVAGVISGASYLVYSGNNKPSSNIEKVADPKSPVKSQQAVKPTETANATLPTQPAISPKPVAIPAPASKVKPPVQPAAPKAVTTPVVVTSPQQTAVVVSKDCGSYKITEAEAVSNVISQANKSVMACFEAAYKTCILASYLNDLTLVGITVIHYDAIVGINPSTGKCTNASGYTRNDDAPETINKFRYCSVDNKVYPDYMSAFNSNENCTDTNPFK
jgi:hypothetical protein